MDLDSPDEMRIFKGKVQLVTSTSSLLGGSAASQVCEVLHCVVDSERTAAISCGSEN